MEFHLFKRDLVPGFSILFNLLFDISNVNFELHAINAVSGSTRLCVRGSGDKQDVANLVLDQLHIRTASCDLLPEFGRFLARFSTT